MGKKSPIEKAIEKRMRLMLMTPEEREKRNAKIRKKIRKMHKATVALIRARHAWLVRRLALMDGEAEPLDEVERAMANMATISDTARESLERGYRAQIIQWEEELDELDHTWEGMHCTVCGYDRATSAEDQQA